MVLSYAHVRTGQADQYLMQLSNRSSRVDSIPQHRAVIMFPVGKCEIIARAGSLDLAITANSISDATLIEDAISDRLDCLAIDEELHYQWIISPEISTKRSG